MSSLNTASKIGIQAGTLIQPETEALDSSISDETAPPDDGSSFVIARPGSSGLAILGRCLKLAVTAPFWMMMGAVNPDLFGGDLGATSQRPAPRSFGDMLEANRRIEENLCILNSPLTAHTYEEKMRAAQFLGEHRVGVERAISALLKWAKHINSRKDDDAVDLAMTAVHALEQIDTLQAIKALHQYLNADKTKYISVEYEVMRILGRLERDGAVPIMEKYLPFGSDGNKDRTFVAIEVLEQIGTRAATHALLRHVLNFLHGSDETKMAAVGALARLRMETAVPYLTDRAIYAEGAHGIELAKAIVTALPDFGATGRYMLAAYIIQRAKDPGVRKFAFETLGRIRAEDAVPHLETFMMAGVQHAEDYEHIIDTLGDIASPSAIAVLRRMENNANLHDLLKARARNAIAKNRSLAPDAIPADQTGATLDTAGRAGSRPPVAPQGPAVTPRASVLPPASGEEEGGLEID